MAAHELDPDDSTMLLLEALESTRQTNKQSNVATEIEFRPESKFSDPPHRETNSKKGRVKINKIKKFFNVNLNKIPNETFTP